MNVPADIPSGEEALAQAVYLFAPVIRLLQSQGVTYPQLAEALKNAFIDAALDAAPAPARVTDSKLAVITGIHRKDIKRLRETAAARQAGATDVRPSLASVVFTRWLSDPAYCQPDGAPLPLARQGTGPQSFEALVKSVSRDVHPRTVLDELRRLQLVQADDDEVRPRTNAFVPRADFSSLLRYMSANLHDHAAAAVRNVLGAGPALLEQSVFSSTVDNAAIDALSTLVRSEWNRIVKTMVPEIEKHEVDGEPDGAEALSRIRLGMYFYAD
ncbi:MAG: DUF6502 family protein [Noviherbaspirillum sp.]